MKIGNQLKLGSAILVLLMGITISCTRSLSVPVSPSFTQTTPTSTATNTQIATNTPTNTPTNTITPVLTNTPTNTPTNTCTATATNTLQFSATNTPTATISNTPTNTLSPTSTATNTATSTPTANPNMIADFEEGGLQDVTTNGLGLSGYWYPVTDVSSTATTALDSTGAGGCATGSYVSIGGTTGPTGNVYAQLQGDFVNPTGAYSIPGSYNAFVFCIKSSTLTQVLFQVSDKSTTQSSANAQVYVPVSSSWTSVTVCFDHMQSPSWAPCSIQGHMFDPTSAISASWQVNTTSTAYDIELDNFQFLSGGTCPAFTATPNPNYTLIDDFEQTGGSPKDSGNLYVATDQNGKVRDGGWFDFTDAGSTAVTNFASSPAQSGTYAAEFSGTMNLASSYAGFGFNFVNMNGCPNSGVSLYDATVGGLYTGIVFYAEAKSMSATNCTGVQPVVVDLVDNSGTPDHNLAIPVTAAYQPYTIFYNQCLNSAGTAVDPTHLYQVVFKPQNNGNSSYNYDFMVDNIQFTNAAAPAAATPVPNSVVDNFQNGSNEIQFPYVGAGQGGYWFDYSDATDAPGLCPLYISGAGSEPGFFLSSPGNAGVVTGVPSFCASFYASTMASGGSGGYGGMGFAFHNSGTVDLSGGGAWTHLVFSVKSAHASSYIVMLNDSNTTGDGCYGPGINFYPYNTSYSSATATTSWVPVTISFISTAGDYNLGLPTIVNGTTGCNKTINGGNPYAFGYTIANQIQWQAAGTGSAYDLEVGNIYLY